MPSCRTTKGKFIRCPGAKAPKRKHRRRRKDWSSCGCPSGSERVDHKRADGKGRGWACVKRTKRGPRFVAATCANGK